MPIHPRRRDFEQPHQRPREPGQQLHGLSGRRREVEVAYYADPKAALVHPTLAAVRTDLVRHAPEEDLVTVVHQLDPEVIADIAPALRLDVVAPDRLPRDGSSVLGERVMEDEHETGRHRHPSFAH